MDFASVSGICDPVGKLLENAADSERHSKRLQYSPHDPWFVRDDIDRRRTNAKKSAELWYKCAELCEKGESYRHLIDELMRLV